MAADGGYPQALFTLERWLFESANDLPARIYATRAYTNGPTQALPFDGLIERLRQRGYPNLQIQWTELQTDHGGAVVPSYREGLNYMFGIER